MTSFNHRHEPLTHVKSPQTFHHGSFRHDVHLYPRNTSIPRLPSFLLTTECVYNESHF